MLVVVDCRLWVALVFAPGVFSVSRRQEDRDDDIAALKRNKVGVRFSELVSILKAHGWEHRSTSGSHCVFAKKACQPILLVKAHGNNKYCYPMDVNKVIAALEVDESEEAEGNASCE